MTEDPHLFMVHVKKLVYTLNGHARPLALLSKTLNCYSKAGEKELSEAAFTQTIKGIYPYDFPGLDSSTFEELLLAVFDGRDFDTDDKIGQRSAGDLQKGL